MIPSDITFDANATPPQWTDNGEQVIEKGTNIRIKIKGLRSEVDKMFAVGTMKEVSRPACYRMLTLLNISRITLVLCLNSHSPGYNVQEESWLTRRWSVKARTSKVLLIRPFRSGIRRKKGISLRCVGVWFWQLVDNGMLW